MTRRPVLAALLLGGLLVGRPGIAHAAPTSINATVVGLDPTVRTDQGMNSWFWSFTGTAVGTSPQITVMIDLGLQFQTNLPFCAVFLDDHQGDTLAASCTLPPPIPGSPAYINVVFSTPVQPYGSTGKFVGLGAGTLSGVATMVAVTPPVIPSPVSIRPPAVLIAQLQLS